jgi:outer membrane protein
MVSDSSENDVAEPLARARRPQPRRRDAGPNSTPARSVAAGIALVALLAAAMAARADEGGNSAAAPPVDRPASEVAGSTAADEAGSAPTAGTAPAQRAPTWETAAGLFVNYGPTYSGSDKWHTSFQLGLYIRRGRWTLTNRSDLVTRRGEEVVPGLSSELIDRSNLRVAAGLRIDQGRGTSSDPALAGLDSIPATVRLRVVADSRLPGPWQASVATTIDLLRRGAGTTLALRGWRNLTFGPGTRASIGAGIDGGDARYMQNWYGITEDESARTGYAVYQPGAGLSQFNLGANLRKELDDPWVVFASGGLSTLIGPARSSPLTRRTSGWGVNFGVARHF